MPGTTGSIEWRRPGPKTIELYNTDRAPRDQPIMQDMYMQEMNAWQPSDAELQRQQDQYKADESRFHTGGRPQTAAGLRQEARQQRRQLRGFDRYLKQGGTDLAGGFQELVESGAAWVDDKGDVYTALPHHAGEDPESAQRILQAAREWGRMQDTLAKMMQQGATQDDLRRYMQSGGR